MVWQARFLGSFACFSQPQVNQGGKSTQGESAPEVDFLVTDTL
jgi:hypothetical protein